MRTPHVERDGRARARRRSPAPVGTLAAALVLASAGAAAFPGPDNAASAALEVGDGLIATTTAVLRDRPGSVTSVACIDTSTCIVGAGEATRTGPPGVALSGPDDVDGVLLRTTDAGVTWSTVTTPPGTRRITAVDCTVAACVAAAPTAAGELSRWRVLRSVDAGATWTTAALPNIFGRSVTIECADTGCYAMVQPELLDGPTAILRSDATAANWTRLADVPSDFSAMYCIDLDNCIREPGRLVGVPSRTIDGGVTWTPVNVPAGVTGLEISGCARTRCYVDTNSSRTGGYTDDVGLTWAAHPRLSRFFDAVACGPSRCYATAFDEITMVANAVGFVETPVLQRWSGLNTAEMACPTDTVCLSVGDQGDGRPAFISRTTFAPVPVVAVRPARLLDTRPGELTVDNLHLGIGKRSAGSTYVLPVRGRGEIAHGAGTLVANVTVTQAAGPGFITVYPCDRDRPLASSVNYIGNGDVVANAVTVPIAPDGTVCLYTSEQADLIVDANAYGPAAVPGITAIQPARLLETRPGLVTIDGRSQGEGAFAAGEVRAVAVRGRGNVPTDASMVTLNVGAVDPAGPGFLTVYPCNERPTASNLNYAVGATASNAATVPIAADGTICIYSLAAAHVIADVTAYVPASASGVSAVPPARLLDTRSGPDNPTVDGQMNGIGKPGVGGRIVLPVAGRGNVPADARTVTVTVTATEPDGSGFITLTACPDFRLSASNLNYRPGQTVANAATVQVSAAGTICVDVAIPTHVVVDVNAYSR